MVQGDTMKNAIFLISLLFVSCTHPTQVSTVPAINCSDIEFKKQEQSDNTKIKLAIIAGIVTIVIMYCKGSSGVWEASVFDKMIVDLSKK